MLAAGQGLLDILYNLAMAGASLEMKNNTGRDALALVGQGLNLDFYTRYLAIDILAVQYAHAGLNIPVHVVESLRSTGSLDREILEVLVRSWAEFCKTDYSSLPARWDLGAVWEEFQSALKRLYDKLDASLSLRCARKSRRNEIHMKMDVTPHLTIGFGRFID